MLQSIVRINIFSIKSFHLLIGYSRVYLSAEKLMSVKMAELSHVELAAVQRIHWTEEINSKCFQFILSHYVLCDFIYECQTYYIVARISN
jgi:hypothetical protein